MSGADFFRDFQNDIYSRINTAMPAKVLSYDEATCTAKIKPLFRVEVEKDVYEDREVIEGVPVLKHQFKVNGGPEQTYVPFLQNGSVVQVIFNQSAIDQARKGHTVDPSARKFSITDAVIVGVFP